MGRLKFILKILGESLMRCYSIIFAGFIAFYIGGVKAEMISVNSISDVEVKIEQLLKHYKSKEILTAFDIDMTLTQPDHPAAFYPNLKKHIDIYKRVMSSLTSEQKDLTSTLTIQLPVRLVEQNTPEVIKSIQRKGIDSIAFTAMLTGLPKGISKINDRTEKIRFNSLNSLSINFENSFKEREIIFNDVSAHNNNYPVFFRGILCSNGEKGKDGKGAVLVAFIKKTTISPKVIILVDDKKKNLEDVEQYLKAHDPTIQFIGIEYQGAFTYAPKDINAKDFERFWENMANEAKESLLAKG